RPSPPSGKTCRAIPARNTRTARRKTRPDGNATVRSMIAWLPCLPLLGQRQHAAKATPRLEAPMKPIDMLRALRNQGGQVRTHGLDDATIERFAGQGADLAGAIADAHASFVQLKAAHPEVLGMDEDAQLHALQSGFVNFYPDDAVCPFVPLAARGAWIVTLKGAVLYDCGGYGMLGFGHNPPAVMKALAKPQAMANVMTPSLAQHAFTEALRKEIGHHAGKHPFAKFMCLNSGSESATLAARIADVNAKLMTDAGAKYAGRTIKRLVVKGAFHGRTERPALYS